MTRLLVTTFQKAGHNLKEAQVFKAEALSSKLVSVDRTNELWPVPQALKHTAKTPGILEVGSRADERLFGFLQLSMTQGAGWKRLTKDHKAAFEAFLASLYAEPIHCWVIGGHHHSAYDAYTAMAWGTAYEKAELYRPYVGFGIDKATSELEWFSYRESAKTPRDIALPGAAARLKSVCLMLVLGCNGIPRKVGSTIYFRELAEAWRKLTEPALILGWFGVHGMPLNTLQQQASKYFWAELEQLKGKHGIPDDGLPALVAAHADAVIQAWGQACQKAFGHTDQRDLWHVRAPGADGARGAGAIRPSDGAVFHANPKYPTIRGAPAMIEAGFVAP